MPEETKPTPETATPPDGGIGAALLSAGSLGWLRHLLYNVGGRKVAVFAGSLYGILELAGSNALQGWQLTGAVAGVAVLGVGTVLAIAWEDRQKAPTA